MLTPHFGHYLDYLSRISHLSYKWSLIYFPIYCLSLPARTQVSWNTGNLMVYFVSHWCPEQRQVSKSCQTEEFILGWRSSLQSKAVSHQREYLPWLHLLGFLGSGLQFGMFMDWQLWKERGNTEWVKGETTMWCENQSSVNPPQEALGLRCFVLPPQPQPVLVKGLPTKSSDVGSDYSRVSRGKMTSFLSERPQRYIFILFKSLRPPHSLILQTSMCVFHVPGIVSSSRNVTWLWQIPLSPGIKSPWRKTTINKHTHVSSAMKQYVSPRIVFLDNEEEMVFYQTSEEIKGEDLKPCLCMDKPHTSG